MKGRWLQLLVVSPVAVALLYFGYRYGPSPDDFPGRGRTPGEVSAGASPPPLYPGDMMLQLLGSTRTLAGSGCDALPVSDFFARLELQKRAQGFQTAEAPLPPGSAATGVLWRSSDEKVEFLGSAGPGASREMEITEGESAPGCGTLWRTFRYSVPSQPPGSKRTVAGQSPGGFPLPEGMRIIFHVTGPAGGDIAAYQSEQPDSELTRWFRSRMTPPWELRQVEGGTQPAGLLYYTRGSRYCLIWIAGGGDAGGSSILVSTGTS